jgi:hypothetical protein
MNNPSTLPTREQLLTMSKEQLAASLLLAMQAQQLTTQNMTAMTDLLVEANARLAEITDKLASQEAELIMLRNRP